MGLNYFCQRYYDPQIGRFITLDPFGGYTELPQSQNRYAYVMNNPLKYIDPLGLDWHFPNDGTITTEDGTFSVEVGEIVILEVCLDLVSSNVDFEHKLAMAAANSIRLRRYDLARFRHPTNRNILGQGRHRDGSSGGGSGNPSPGGNAQSRKCSFPQIGMQFQSQATFLWWGAAAGAIIKMFPGEIKSYSFDEFNKGFGCGLSAGPIVVWGSDPLEGEMAEFTLGIGLITASFYDNGSTKAFFIGIGVPLPFTMSSGYVETILTPALFVRGD